MTPLRQAWLEHLEQHPKSRTLQVAHALDVSEAELVFSRVGDDATLLRPDWKALLEGLPAVGPVMCLTRNEHVVHERIGPYERVEVTPHMAGIYGQHIDQRLILARWATAIATPVETRRGVLQSVQVFDGAGTAVLKLYAREATDPAAWEALIASLAVQRDDLPPALEVRPLPARPDRPDEDVDAEGMRAAWAAMQDTHEVHPLLRRLQVGRLQATRLLGAQWATPVDPSSLQTLLEGCAADEEPIMIFVGNTGSIQIHSGLVRRIVVMGDWLNVMDPDFNLHVHSPELHTAWVVRKPTDRGLVWSFEAFDPRGTHLIQLFGKRTEARSQRASWHQRLAALQQAHTLA